MSGKRWLVLAVSAVLALGVAACGGGDEEDEGEFGGRDLSGEIRIDGSSTLGLLTAKMGEFFEAEYPGITVTVEYSGTRGGFEALCAGRIDIADASSSINPEEATECSANGVRFEELQVATDAIAVVTNPENPVSCLTLDQLSAIWSPDSTIQSWGQIPGQGFPFDAPLSPYGPGPATGTFDVFTEVVNGQAGAIRGDFEEVGVKHAATVARVAKDPGGIGFTGRPVLTERQGYVKILGVDGGGGCVPSSLESIQDASYPALRRPLYLYPTAESVGRPEVAEFVRYYLRYVNDIVEGSGLVGLNKEQLRESRTELRSLGPAD